METNSNKKNKLVDYEADMERLCDKVRLDGNYEFSIKEVVDRRTIDFKGLGREGYSEEGYKDIKIPILEGEGFIRKISGNKFKLTDKGKKYCKDRGKSYLRV